MTIERGLWGFFVGPIELKLPNLETHTIFVGSITTSVTLLVRTK